MTELAEGLSLGTRFRLLSLLGEGGMGQVWLATDADRNTTIALKILNSEIAPEIRSERDGEHVDGNPGAAGKTDTVGRLGPRNGPA